jgi:hypothetical protein
VAERYEKFRRMGRFIDAADEAAAGGGGGTAGPA